MAWRRRFALGQDHVMMLIVIGLFLVGCFTLKMPQPHGRSLLQEEEVVPPASAYCEAHFGYPWLHAWAATTQDLCTPVMSAAPGSIASRVTCRSWVDEHMPAASAPHALCDAHNLLLRPGKAVRARCPKHRPGYLCTMLGYHRYPPGSFAEACAWPKVNLSEFSADHLRDIFESVSAGQGAELRDVDEKMSHREQEADGGVDGAAKSRRQLVQTPTLFITRETGEHANLYHTLTDAMNAFLTLRVLGWNSWALLIADEHPPGPFDELWRRLHRRGGAVGRVGDGGNVPALPRLSDLDPGREYLYEAIAFSPPGYSSLLYADLYAAASCPERTQLFADLRAFLLGLFDPDKAVLGRGYAGHAKKQLEILLITRQPTRRRPHVPRQLGNEGELLEALGAVPPVRGRAITARLVDFAALPLDLQLETVARADLVVGMHGAGLAHALLAPPGAAVLELWPQPEGVWRCYEHFAAWAGLHYGRWANEDPERHMTHGGGDVTFVDAAAVASLAQQLLERAVDAALAAAS